MRILPAAGVAALLLAVTLPVLATTQTGPFVVSVTASPNPYAIEGKTSVSKSAGILAESTGTGDSALEGYAEGQDSAGLEGFAKSSSGTASNGVYGYAANGYGVYGQAQTATDAGVLGLNLSTSEGATGVLGKATGAGIEGITTDDGEGVAGDDASADGAGTGVLGESTGGTGIFGISATGRGVFGDAVSGTGVTGDTDDTTNPNATYPGITGNSSGVLGADETDSSTVTGNTGVTGTSNYGVGVVGTSVNGTAIYGSSRNSDGIYGNTDSDFQGVVGESQGGQGVEGLGEDKGSSGMVPGVEGDDETDSSSLTTDMGVYGYTAYGQGVYGDSFYHQGVYGNSNQDTGVAAISNTGSGLVAETSSTTDAGIGIYANGGGDVIDAIGSPDGANSTENVMSLDGSGNMILAGGLTQHGTPKSTVRDATGAERVAYSPRDTQATTEDFGRVQMVRGRAEVRLDPVFASTLADADYLVFLTGRGDSDTLYVANASLGGFEIREHGGASTLAIDYRIVGHPRAERPEPRLALLAPHTSLGMQHLIRSAQDIARIAALHRAAEPKQRKRLALLEHTLHNRPRAARVHPAIRPKRVAPPYILVVRPNEYGPRLQH